jgi:hypothetical protein
LAIVYNTTVLNNRLQQVVAAIDAGAGNGLLNVGTANMGVVLATITLASHAQPLPLVSLRWPVHHSQLSASTVALLHQQS